MVPCDEAKSVHRRGGRYAAIIGFNDLYHNQMDRGGDVVDLNAIERFAGAFAMMAKSLAGA
jgi:hypothetical protein